MTTTDPGADKAVQALSNRLAEVADTLHLEPMITDQLVALLREAHAALTHRQQGVVGQAELRNVIENYANAKADLALHPTHESAKVYFKLISGQLTDVFAAFTSGPPAQPQCEPLAMELLRTDFKRECDDTDMILRMLGLEPENCRTDGGSLKTGMILDALQARDRMLQRTALAAQPPERAAQQEPQEARKAYGALIQIAAEWAQRKPLDYFAHLDGVSHIGHRQFAHAYGPAHDACAGYAARLRDAADLLMKHASPPRAVEPLTDERLHALWASGWGAYCSKAAFVAIARAIERAHNITKE